MLWSLLLAYLAGNVAAGALTIPMLGRRGPQASAVCGPEFEWADSSQGLSPCLLAAVVCGACQGGGWHIPALNSTDPQYAFPTSTTANVCTCSWLAYNLLAACACCQDFAESVPNEAPYFQSCQGFTTATSSYFPANYSLPEDIFIPYWATTDPNTWPAHKFDVPTAKNISQQGHPDINKSTTSPSKKKRPIGAIVGGVIGGLALTVLAVGTAFHLYRRQHATHPLASPSVIMERLTHIRTPSDMTTTSLNSFGYAALTDEYIIEPFTSQPINIPLGGRKNATEPPNTSLISILSREPRRPPSTPPTYSDANHFLSPPATPREQRPSMYQKNTSGVQNGRGRANERSVSPIGYVAITPEIPTPIGSNFVDGPSRDANRPRSQGNASSVDPRDIA